MATAYKGRGAFHSFEKAKEAFIEPNDLRGFEELPLKSNNFFQRRAGFFVTEMPIDKRGP